MIQKRSELAETPAHDVALECLEAGIRAVQPDQLVENAFELEGKTLYIGETAYDLREYSELVVVGGGKAAGKMAAALEERLGDRITDGVVVTNTPVGTTRVTEIEGSHPVPDETGVEGAERVLETASEAGAETLVLTVITGGGSALLPAPAGEVSLADLQTVTDDLLSVGATIHEINAVRKHLSKIKGGQLARAAAPATVATLVISDVVGDDLDVIASGPTVPDTSTYRDAVDILEGYGVAPPESVEERLAAGLDGRIPETPEAGSSFFDAVDVHVLANGFEALSAAREVASSRGYTTEILTSRLRGEAREVAKTHVAVAEEIRATGNPVEPPAVVFTGGETTVTVEGSGRGGPNQELAVSAAIELSEPDVVVASVDTDGIDGKSDAAGGIVDEKTAASAEAARSALADNDVTPFLEEASALIRTGSTGTNVNDMTVVVVEDDA